MYADSVPSRHERQRNVEMGNEFLIMSQLRYTNEGLILYNYLSSLYSELSVPLHLEQIDHSWGFGWGGELGNFHASLNPI